MAVSASVRAWDTSPSSFFVDIHRSLVEAVRDYAIYALDPDGTILTWNAGAELIEGYCAEEIIGQNYSCFFRPDDIKADKPAQELMTAATLGRFHEEGWRVRKDGSCFWAEVILTPILDVHGRPEAFAKVTRDLSDRRAGEEQLGQEFVSPNKADRAKALFLVNMSHELRTPLNAIMGFSEVMRSTMFGAIDERYREYAVAIHDSGAHLLELINDVIDLARLDAGKIELNRSIVDLDELILGVIQMLSGQAAQAELSLEYENAADCSINCDGQRVRQMLVHLLSNAIKFTPRGGRVSVVFDVLEANVEIRIRDTGMGLSPDEIAEAFDRFGQTRPAFYSTNQAVGLGLPIARALAELHGGSLTLESMPGIGTTTIVRLPC